MKPQRGCLGHSTAKHEKPSRQTVELLQARFSPSPNRLDAHRIKWNVAARKVGRDKFPKDSLFPLTGSLILARREDAKIEFRSWWLFSSALSQATEAPKMNGKLIVDTLPPEDVCYTGKPYSKELGAYVFNARSYDVENSRWTTPDPSGFSDGANGYTYGNNPGASPSEALVNRYINATTSPIDDWAINSDTQNKIVANSGFSTVRTYVDNWLPSGSDKHGGYDSSQDTIFGIVTADLSSDYDLGHSIGHFDVQVRGTIAPTWDSSLKEWGYNGNLDVSFTDAYDFATGGGWQTDVFARLQNHGYTPSFSVTGDWSVAFSGGFE